MLKGVEPGKAPDFRTIPQNYLPPSAFGPASATSTVLIDSWIGIQIRDWERIRRDPHIEDERTGCTESIGTRH